MTTLLIWIVAFALIAYFTYQRWESVSQSLDKLLPSVMKSHGENRNLWVGTLAVLGATTLVRPVEVLLVAILLGIIALVIMKLASLASNISH